MGVTQVELLDTMVLVVLLLLVLRMTALAWQIGNSPTSCSNNSRQAPVSQDLSRRSPQRSFAAPTRTIPVPG